MDKLFETNTRTAFEMNGTTLKEFMSVLVEKTLCDDNEAERIASIIRKDYEACAIKDDVVIIDAPPLARASVYYDKTDAETLAVFGRPTCFSIGVR